MPTVLFPSLQLIRSDLPHFRRCRERERKKSSSVSFRCGDDVDPRSIERTGPSCLLLAISAGDPPVRTSDHSGKSSSWSNRTSRADLRCFGLGRFNSRSLRNHGLTAGKGEFFKASTNKAGKYQTGALYIKMGGEEERRIRSRLLHQPWSWMAFSFSLSWKAFWRYRPLFPFPPSPTFPISSPPRILVPLSFSPGGGEDMLACATKEVLRRIEVGREESCARGRHIRSAPAAGSVERESIEREALLLQRKSILTHSSGV